MNDELGVLRTAIPAAVESLCVGGRLVVLAYQSLEDKIVKSALVSRSTSPVPVDLPFVPEGATPELRLLVHGSEKASAEEVAANPRAASVRLRAAERLRSRRMSTAPGLDHVAARPAPRRRAPLALVPARPADAQRRRSWGARRSSRSSCRCWPSGCSACSLLNTALAQDAFRLHTLTQEHRTLGDREEALRREVEALRAPQELAARATALGMVPAGPPAFLRLSDGEGARRRRPGRGARAGPAAAERAGARRPGPRGDRCRAGRRAAERVAGSAGRRSSRRRPPAPQDAEQSTGSPAADAEGDGQ